MLPSSPQADVAGNDGASPLRRYGPIAVIAVVVVVIAVVVATSGGDKKSKTTATGSTTTAAGSPGSTAGPVNGALSFSQAAGRTDVTFPDGCDKTTGKLAMPYYFAAECFANVADNGGATAKGVTADAITVVVYIGQENDPILKFITSAIAVDDTNEQVEQTYQGFTDMFQRFSQTYGRKVQLKFLVGSGNAADTVAARADAVKATEQLGAFAVWGGPALAPAWTEEIKAHGVVCLGCPAIADNSPVVFPITASSDQTRTQLVEYMTKKLKGKPAAFAGDAAFKAQPRKFGLLFIDTGGSQQADANDLKKQLGANGVELGPLVSYSLNPATLQEQAVTVITQLKSAGVTSVVFAGDPVAPGTFTREATKQQYQPEWIIGGSALVDTTAFARTYDQAQWAHAFGISSLTARVKPDVDPSQNLFKWFTGHDAPAFDSSGVLFPQPALFFVGLQAAGPKLTADSFRTGLFSVKPFSGAVTQASISYGDHGFYPGTDFNGIDDFTEIWWDATATGPDEIRKQGTGMYRYVDGGKRYLPGQWTSDVKLFDPAGSVTVFDAIPPNEKPKDYPSPAG